MAVTLGDGNLAEEGSVVIDGLGQQGIIEEVAEEQYSAWVLYAPMSGDWVQLSDLHLAPGQDWLP